MLLLIAAAAVLGAAARLPGVLAGFAAHLGLGLRPGQRGKALRNARGLDKVVGHVDEELEGQAEAVLDQPRGEKDRLGRAEDGVAMADGAVAQIDGVAGRDHDLAGVGDGQRNKVIGAVVERGRERGRHGAHQPLQVRIGDARLAPDGVVDSVGSLGHGHLRGHLLRVPKLDLCAARHETVF